MRNGYELFVRPLLFSLDAETAHHVTMRLLGRSSQFDVSLNALKLFRPRPKPITLFGLKFPNPIGLAPGLDKNGVALPAWAALGFGFIEIGTVTAIAQRLAALRVSGRWPAVPVGINIGKSRTTPLEQATDDYLYSFRMLRDFADYITLNISSPNTLGLRELQEPEKLSELLYAIGKEARTAPKPLVVKISPDMSDTELKAILAVCEENLVSGIIATNTTLDHSSIATQLDQAGGLSGAPLRDKSTALVREINARSTIPVIASGGIFDAESAREKFQAGAVLIQLYTGLVYRGPQLLREIMDRL